MGVCYGLITFQKKGNRILPCFITGKQKYSKILPDATDETIAALAQIEAEEIYVKYTVKRIGQRDLNEHEKGFPLERVTFMYSTDGCTYHTAGEMESIPGRWVGVKNGIFCVSEKAQSAGYVMVEDVNYSR